MKTINLSSKYNHNVTSLSITYVPNLSIYILYRLLNFSEVGYYSFMFKD